LPLKEMAKPLKLNDLAKIFSIPETLSMQSLRGWYAKLV